MMGNNADSEASRMALNYCFTDVSLLFELGESLTCNWTFNHSERRVVRTLQSRQEFNSDRSIEYA
jgi:hypothetical protein